MRSLPDVDTDPDCSTVQWEHFHLKVRDYTWWWAFVKTKYFWLKVDLGLRTALIAILPVAAMIASLTTRSSFATSQVPVFGGLIGSGPALGSSLWIVSQFLKGAMFWVPFCTAMAAGRLWEYQTAWYFVYTFAVFFICIFATGVCKRLTLVGFNIIFILQVHPVGQSLKFPSLIVQDFAIGFCFGIASTLFPFPKLVSWGVDRNLGAVEACLSRYIPLAKSAFWAASNVDRQATLGEMRHLRKLIDDTINATNPLLMFMDFEFFLGSEAMQLRKYKVALLRNLEVQAMAMQRGVEVLGENPQIITNPQRAEMFYRHISGPLLDLAVEAKVCLKLIVETTSREELQNTLSVVKLREAAAALTEGYNREHMVKISDREISKLRVCLNAEKGWLQPCRDVHLSPQAVARTARGSSTHAETDYCHVPEFNDPLLRKHSDRG